MHRRTALTRNSANKLFSALKRLEPIRTVDLSIRLAKPLKRRRCGAREAIELEFRAECPFEIRLLKQKGAEHIHSSVRYRRIQAADLGAVCRPGRPQAPVKAVKLATYNVNAINGRLDVLVRWLEEASVACEIRVSHHLPAGWLRC